MTSITSIAKPFNEDEIMDIAVEVQFTKRNRKIDPVTFCKTLIQGAFELKEYSLDLFCEYAESIKRGINLSKQALHKKMKPGAKLLKKLFENVVQEQMNSVMDDQTIEVLKQFHDVKINDATTISLPKKLKEHFKGYGGRNSESAIKIQATYSLFKSELTAIDFSASTVHDVNHNDETIAHLATNDLVIKDLGYYDFDYFKQINQKQAFYISRIKSSTVLYRKNADGHFSEIRFKKMFKKTKAVIDKDVYIKKTGGHEYLKVRLTAIQLPKEKSESKKRVEYRKANKSGVTLSEKKKVHLAWFITISNIPMDMLCTNTVIDLYRLRWQIELQFKAFKTSLNLETFGAVGKDYFYCMMYAKLIMLVVTMRMYSYTKKILYAENQRYISIQKFFRLISNRLKRMDCLWSYENEESRRSLKDQLLRLGRRSYFDKRRCVSTEERLKGYDLPEVTLNMLLGEQTA